MFPQKRSFWIHLCGFKFFCFKRHHVTSSMHESSKLTDRFAKDFRESLGHFFGAYQFCDPHLDGIVLEHQVSRAYFEAQVSLQSNLHHKNLVEFFDFNCKVLPLPRADRYKWGEITPYKWPKINGFCWGYELEPY